MRIESHPRIFTTQQSKRRNEMSEGRSATFLAVLFRCFVTFFAGVLCARETNPVGWRVCGVSAWSPQRQHPSREQITSVPFDVKHRLFLSGGSNHQIHHPSDSQHHNRMTMTFQTSLLRSVWRLATKIGMRRLGGMLKRWYPAAYGDTIFYFDTAHYCIGDDGVQGYVALTIDDGLCRCTDGYGGSNDSSSSPSMVSKVCALLRSYNARATFFVCSDYIPSTDDAHLLLQEGHELGNHLKEDVSGYYFRLSDDDFEAELTRANGILQNIIDTRPSNDTAATAATAATDDDDGDDNISPSLQPLRWFRAPQGIMSPSMSRILLKHNLTNVLGDCYCDDWAFAEHCGSTAGVVAPLMLSQVQPPSSGSSIAIFHMPQRDFRESTLDALREFLQGLQERNLQCVTLSELQR